PLRFFQYRYVFSACTGYPTVTVLALITTSLSAPISTVPTDTTQGHRYPPGVCTLPEASTSHTPACRESTEDDMRSPIGWVCRSVCGPGNPTVGGRAPTSSWRARLVHQTFDTGAQQLPGELDHIVISDGHVDKRRHTRQSNTVVAPGVRGTQLNVLHMSTHPLT